MSLKDVSNRVHLPVIPTPRFSSENRKFQIVDDGKTNERSDSNDVIPQPTCMSLSYPLIV